jgi:hypothetical protein
MHYQKIVVSSAIPSVGGVLFAQLSLVASITIYIISMGLSFNYAMLPITKDKYNSFIQKKK